MTKKKKTLDELIEEALKNAPQIKNYSVKQLEEITSTPWPSTRWHLELLEPRGHAITYELKLKRKE